MCVGISTELRVSNILKDVLAIARLLFGGEVLRAEGAALQKQQLKSSLSMFKDTSGGGTGDLKARRGRNREREVLG